MSQTNIVTCTRLLYGIIFVSIGSSACTEVTRSQLYSWKRPATAPITAEQLSGVKQACTPSMLSIKVLLLGSTAKRGAACLSRDGASECITTFLCHKEFELWTRKRELHQQRDLTLVLTLNASVFLFIKDSTNDSVSEHRFMWCLLWKPCLCWLFHGPKQMIKPPWLICSTNHQVMSSTAGISLIPLFPFSCCVPRYGEIEVQRRQLN